MVFNWFHVSKLFSKLWRRLNSLIPWWDPNDHREITTCDACSHGCTGHFQKRTFELYSLTPSEAFLLCQAGVSSIPSPAHCPHWTLTITATLPNISHTPLQNCTWAQTNTHKQRKEIEVGCRVKEWTHCRWSHHACMNLLPQLCRTDKLSSNTFVHKRAHTSSHRPL